MKKFLVILGLAISTVSFGQKKSAVTYSLGAQSLVELVSGNSLAYGAFTQAELKSGNTGYTLNAGYLGTKSSAQFPILAGAKYHFNDKVSVGAGAGVILTNGSKKAEFAYSPAITIAGSKFNVDLKFLSTVLKGKDQSNVGLGISVNL